MKIANYNRPTRHKPLLVKVSLAFLLIPLDAVDVIAISEENLIAQFARANYRIEVNQIDNLAQRLVGVLAVEVPKFVIIAVSLEKSFQDFVSIIDVARLH